MSLTKEQETYLFRLKTRLFYSDMSPCDMLDEETYREKIKLFAKNHIKFAFIGHDKKTVLDCINHFESNYLANLDASAKKPNNGIIGIRLCLTNDSILMCFGLAYRHGFNFTANPLTNSMLGIVIVVDGDTSARDVLNIIAAAKKPFIIAALHDENEETIRKQLHIGLEVPILPCKPRDTESIRTIMQTLLDEVLQS